MDMDLWRPEDGAYFDNYKFNLNWSKIQEAINAIVAMDAQIREIVSLMEESTDRAIWQLQQGLSASLQETREELSSSIGQVSQDLAQFVETNNDEHDAINAHLYVLDGHIVEVRHQAEEAEAIARGASRARVFEDEDAMRGWLDDPDNVAKLVIGDNFYVIDPDSPDFWWDGATVRKLETDKVDLSNIYTMEDVNILLAGKEPAIPEGAATQYWRGDKTFQDLMSAVRATTLAGLTSSTSELAATDTILVALGKAMGRINARAPLASPALTGTPTAPTAAQTVNNTQVATTAFVRTATEGFGGVVRNRGGSDPWDSFVAGDSWFNPFDGF